MSTNSENDDDETKKGMTFIILGMLGYGVSEAFSAVGSIGQADMIREETTINGGSTGAACLGSLVGLVAFLLLVAGIYKIYQGSKSLSGFKHARKVKIGGGSILVGVLVSLFGASAVIGSEISTIGEARSMLINASIVGAIGGILLIAGLIYLVYELGTEKQKKYAMGILGLYIIVRIGTVMMMYNVPSGDEYEMVASMFRRGGLSTGLESIFSFTLAGFYFFVRENYLNEKVKKQNKDIEWTSPDTKEKGYGRDPRISVKECPVCQEKELVIEKDGSAYCEGCGYSTVNYSGWENEE